MEPLKSNLYHGGQRRMRSRAIVESICSKENVPLGRETKGKERGDTNHIDFGNRTHTAHHDVDLNRGRRTTEVWSHAVVVTAKQIVQELAYVAVIIALRPLPRGRFRSCRRSATIDLLITIFIR